MNPREESHAVQFCSLLFQIAPRSASAIYPFRCLPMWSWFGLRASRARDWESLCADACVTMSYAFYRVRSMGTLTMRLDEKLERELARLAKRTGRSKSEVAREALRRQLSIQRFRALRRSDAQRGSRRLPDR